jgi:CBS-domain-containing membrane protein
MTHVSEIMSTNVKSIEPQHSLRRAAGWMAQFDVGSLPVTDGHTLLGIVTDRDITIRGVAAGLTPDQGCVSDVMSPDPTCCKPEHSADEVMKIMGEQQLRRLPVVDAAGRLVGIVALADLARRQGNPIDRVVREISDPPAAVVDADDGRP